MPIAIPDGDQVPITSSELTAYDSALLRGRGAGDRSAQEEALVSAVDDKLAVISSGWTDSGGPGGFQAAVASEVLERAASLQGNIAASVRQWARPGRERALMEMFGSLLEELTERDRLLLELRERVNAANID